MEETQVMPAAIPEEAKRNNNRHKKGRGAGLGAFDPSQSERAEQWRKNQINRIEQGGYIALRQKTTDCQILGALVNIHDSQMERVRDAASHRKEAPINFEFVSRCVAVSEKTSDILNLLNAVMCAKHGRFEYKPPRRISNPIGGGRFDPDAVLDNLVLALDEIEIEKLLEGTELECSAAEIVDINKIDDRIVPAKDVSEPVATT